MFKKITPNLMFRVSCLFSLMCAVLFITNSPASATQQPTKIDADVYDALVQDGTVRVFIMMDTAAYKTPTEASTRSGRSASIEALESQVATQRQSVLSTLSATEYQPIRQFRTVPALAGEVLSAEALTKLNMNPAVQRVSIDDSGGTGMLADTIPLIGASNNFDNGWTGEGITVAVLDSGIDRDHPALGSAALVAESCFLEGTSNSCPDGTDEQDGVGSAEDDFGHGTFVTGVIASDGTGAADRGMAPDVDVVAVKVLDANNAFFTASEIVAGLDYVFTEHPDVQVINMSLGTGRLFNGVCDNAVSWTQAVAFSAEQLRARGTLMFASTGNASNSSAMAVPACIDAVWGVGASTKEDTYGSFTDGSDQIRVVAPGVDIVAPAIGGGIRSWSGTSFASPHVAGCAALLFEKGLSPDDVETRLLQSDVQVTNPENGFSYPRLNCDVDADLSTVTPTNPTPTPTSPTNPPTIPTLPTQDIEQLLDIIAQSITQSTFGVGVPDFIVQIIRTQLESVIASLPSQEAVDFLTQLLDSLDNIGAGSTVQETIPFDEIDPSTIALQVAPDGSVEVVVMEPTAVTLQSVTTTSQITLLFAFVLLSTLSLCTVRRML